MMQIYKGYVLIEELYEKAGVSNSLFFLLKGVEIKKMGGRAVAKVDSLPLKYREIALTCTDLEQYCTYSAFSGEMGRSEDWLSGRERYMPKPFENVKIGARTKLFKLSRDFIKLVQMGLTPFLIDKTNKAYAAHSIKMQGLNIGFY